MRNKIGLLGALAAMTLIDMTPADETRFDKPKESDESKKRRLDKCEATRNKANGLTEFFYGENKLWALNKKVADKKAKKKGWI